MPNARAMPGRIEMAAALHFNRNMAAAHVGIGLFIVRQTANAPGGTVEVESANGRTRFSMVLPREAPAQHVQPPPE